MTMYGLNRLFSIKSYKTIIVMDGLRKTGRKSVTANSEIIT
jgi:hypothetical protein